MNTKPARVGEFEPGLDTHYPGESSGALAVVPAPDTAAFPALASGRHSRLHFGACSGFTRVAARGFAGPP